MLSNNAYIQAAYFLYHAKNVTNLWKQKTLDKITEILCYASLMYLSSAAETMMKRVLKLGNNQLNNILCAMLWPPSLLFLVLTRMIASSPRPQGLVAFQYGAAVTAAILESEKTLGTRLATI